MSTIRVTTGGTVEERLRRLEQALNFSEEIHCHGIIDSIVGATTTATAMGIMGGWTIPWSELRRLMPDARWALYACGWAQAPGTGVVLRLTYQRDDLVTVVLGQQTFATPFGWSKLRIGPFAARGPLAVGIPQGEATQSWNLEAAVAVGGQTLTLSRWTMWLRMSPRAT